MNRKVLLLSTSFDHAKLRRGSVELVVAAIGVTLLNDLNALSGAAQKVRWRLPEFAPAKMLDFGAGPSSALWVYLDCYAKLLIKILGSYDLNIVTCNICQTACDIDTATYDVS
ncbi:hypothetical protein PVAP13_6NG312137 [Panicum virgatum]|uniref:Uncharacterized protein n=1 Tax=Panicum virgatum TaxID=38727 RepID=A0A8T0R2M5_PANVG|nr:hypothetical protein PVAP13_6NG312137 [Panicum virgatum]